MEINESNDDYILFAAESCLLASGKEVGSFKPLPEKQKISIVFIAC